MVERYACDPYGAVTIWNEARTSTIAWANSKQNEILFCGYRFDPESGLYHVRRRVYHPTLGRWLQRDPLGYVDGMGLYEYVGGRPAFAPDPSGMDREIPDATLSRVEGLMARSHAELDLARMALRHADTLERLASILEKKARRIGAADSQGKRALLGRAAILRDMAETMKRCGRTHIAASNYAADEARRLLDATMKDLKNNPAEGFLLGLASICALPFSASGCDFVESTFTHEEIDRKSQRYKDAMQALEAARGVLRGFDHSAAPEEIDKFVRDNRFRQAPTDSGVTIVGSTIVPVKPEHTAGDMAMVLLGEWQRQSKRITSHDYERAGDEARMNEELRAVDEFLRSYASEKGKQFAPTQVWEHPDYGKD